MCLRRKDVQQLKKLFVYNEWGTIRKIIKQQDVMEKQETVNGILVYQVPMSSDLILNYLLCMTVRGHSSTNKIYYDTFNSQLGTLTR